MGKASRFSTSDDEDDRVDVPQYSLPHALRKRGLGRRDPTPFLMETGPLFLTSFFLLESTWGLWRVWEFVRPNLHAE